MIVHSVTSNQVDIYKNLEEVVRKYAATSFLRPVADHTREAFECTCEFVCKFYGADCFDSESRNDELMKGIDSVTRCDVAPFSLVLDSGCGTGESTIHLARKFLDVPVIGIDKSAVRLNKTGEGPANAFWVRAELLDFWRLALEKVNSGEWSILHHALYYPNPWPKESEATRRFHLHPIFPTLLRLSPVIELRTNWEIYAREFKEAASIAAGALSMNVRAECDSYEANSPETAFERKYSAVGQPLYRTLVTSCP